MVNSDYVADFEGVTYFANLALEPRPSTLNSACSGFRAIVVNYVVLIVLFFEVPLLEDGCSVVVDCSHNFKLSFAVLSTAFDGSVRS